MSAGKSYTPRWTTAQRMTLSDLVWPFYKYVFSLYRYIEWIKDTKWWLVLLKVLNANVNALCTSSTLKSTSSESRAISELFVFYSTFSFDCTMTVLPYRKIIAQRSNLFRISNQQIFGLFPFVVRTRGFTCTRRLRKQVMYPWLVGGLGAHPGFLAVSPQVTRQKPGGRLPLLSTRPTVTFPAKEITPLAGTTLYCLVTEAHRCK